MDEGDPLLRAVSEPTRRRMLQVLSSQQLSVSDLAEVLDLPQSTVSRHLRLLREAGLLIEQRHGATVLCSTWPVDPQSLEHAGENGGTAPGAAVLRDRLVEWLARQPLPEDCLQRLDTIRRRRVAHPGGFFDQLGPRWDQLRVEAFGELFHLEALSWLLPPEWTVADIGTGTGYLLPVLAARFRRVVAVDPSPTMLDAARRRPDLAVGGKIDFREGSLERLPMPDGELDAAIACLVLHHVAEPKAALAELRRAVRPGGCVLLVEQELHHDSSFHQRMGDTWWGFEPKSLAEFLKAAGFEAVRWGALSTARPTGRRPAAGPPLFAMVGR